MTKIKKTLGRNWARYHNYYGMNHALERACSKKLHWNQETIREYTVSHAPEVNYQKAKQHVDNPPPLLENDDDDWYQWHPKLLGSGKAPCKQLQPKVQKRRAKQKGHEEVATSPAADEETSQVLARCSVPARDQVVPKVH